MAFLEAVEAEPDKIRGHTALFLRQALMTLLFCAPSIAIPLC
jgi:hypothetical protein